MKFTARKLKAIKNRPGTWDSYKVGVFQDETPIGEYVRNYSMVPFAPFMLNGNWYALASKDYVCTEIMKLPSCEWIGGEPHDSNGFCPAELYVPRYYQETYKSKDGSDHRFTEWDYDVKPGDADVDKYTEFATFGFVSGCVWGDDTSWKVEAFDLREADKGKLTRLQPFGYFEQGARTLRETIGAMDIDPDGQGMMRVKNLRYWTGSIFTGGKLSED
jgi:hypothetical protein